MALFIDIDGTITRPIDDATPPQLHGQTLLALMRQMAVESGGWDPLEAERLIDRIYQNHRWWHWTDYICALDLNPADFWQYAYEKESQHLTLVSPELPRIIERLRAAGYRMFVTSNNPSSGILHKLRVAGLGHNWGSPYFLQYLGATELQTMKSEPEFWKRALAHTGLRPDEVVTIGDSWTDDVIAPLAAGIRHCIILSDRRQNGMMGVTIPTRVDVRHIDSWPQAAKLLV